MDIYKGRLRSGNKVYIGVDGEIEEVYIFKGDTYELSKDIKDYEEVRECLKEEISGYTKLSDDDALKVEVVLNVIRDRLDKERSRLGHNFVVV